MTQIETVRREVPQRDAWRLVAVVLAAAVLFGVLFSMLGFIFRPSLSSVEKRLVGDWMVTSSDMETSEVEYKSDRTFDVRIPGIPEITGRWEVVGDELHVEWPTGQGLWAQFQFKVGLDALRDAVRLKPIDKDHIDAAGVNDDFTYSMTRRP